MYTQLVHQDDHVSHSVWYFDGGPDVGGTDESWMVMAVDAGDNTTRDGGPKNMDEICLRGLRSCI